MVGNACAFAGDVRFLFLPSAEGCRFLMIYDMSTNEYEIECHYRSRQPPPSALRRGDASGIHAHLAGENPNIDHISSRGMLEAL